MTKTKIIAVVSVLALLAAGSLLLVGTVLAQEPTTTPEATPAPWAGGLGHGFGGRSWESFDAMAEALNLTPTQLFEQLHEGKTLEEIAEAQGVDLDAVMEAAQAARIQEMKDAINQAVEDGQITQEQADWLLEGLDKGYIPGRGCFGGFGKGHRGMREFGEFAPSLTPSSTAAVGTSL